MPDVLHAYLHAGWTIREGLDRREIIKTGYIAEHFSVGVAEGDVLCNHCGECAQAVASSGIVEMHGAVGIGLHIARHGVIQNIGAHKVPPHNQRSRNHEDQALCDPEDDEDFEKQAAHDSVRPYRVLKLYCKLVTGPADRLYLVFGRSGIGELPAQPADMHIQATVEWVELAAKDLL